MARLTTYHVNLLNHFKPASIEEGFWFDYVSRLSRKDARVLFKRRQHECLQVTRKPVKPSIARHIQQTVRERGQVRRRKDRARYSNSPQASTQDRRTVTPFHIKE